ncbi:hypothetical protein GBF38_009197, partial [Nibea albiflora]
HIVTFVYNLPLRHYKEIRIHDLGNFDRQQRQKPYQPETRRDESARKQDEQDEMAAGREETVNVPEEESKASEHDAKQEIHRRLCQAKERYRTKKKLHDYMLEDGEELDHRLRELEAENKYLTIRVDEYEAFTAFTLVKETENKMLREENERLTAEV